MVKCTKCFKFVHGACDADADPAAYSAKKESSPDYDYVCSVCKVRPPVTRRKDSKLFPDKLNTVNLILNYLGLDDGSLEGFGQDSMYGDESMDVENSPSDKGEPGTGLGKGKLLSIHSAKKRFGGNRPKFTYQKMKVAEMGKKRGMKSKMRGVFGVPGLGLQVKRFYFKF